MTPLFLFLAEIMQRFGLAISIDAWYGGVVEAIGFLPRDQVTAILATFGHVVSAPVCGITFMTDWGNFHRTVPQIWLSEPDQVCRVSDLAFYLAHELMHVWVWLTQGLTAWPGH